MENKTSAESSEKLAIVILSCDKYSDLWDGFFHQLNKYFPFDNKKYLISNILDYKNPNTKNLSIIKTGEDIDWSTNLLKALDRIPENKLLIILEDIYLSAQFDIKKFLKVQEFTFIDDSQHIKIFSGPKATQLTLDTFIYRYKPGMTYLATVNGIWDKNTLQKIIIPGESAWQFEVNGSYRAQYLAKKFYNLDSDLLPSINIVEKGKWIPSSLKWIKSNNIQIDISRRPIASNTIHKLKKLYFNFIFKTPWQFRQKLINFLKKLLICY